MTTFGAGQISKSARSLVREMIRGDLAIRSASLGTIRNPQTVFCASRMTGTVSLALDVTRHRFVFSRRRDAWAPMTVAVHLQMKPVFDDRPRHRRPVRLSFAPPTFLDSPGSAPPVRLVTPRGRRLDARVDGDRPHFKFDQGPWQTLDMHMPEMVADLVDLIATWARQGNREQTWRFRPTGTTTGPVLRLLARVSRGYTRIARVAADASDDPELEAWDRHLRRIHPQFGSGYFLDRFNATIEVWLDERGRLALDAASDRYLKLAFETALQRRLDHDDIRVTATQPDVLTEGQLHARTIEAMAVNAERFKTAIGDRFGFVNTTHMRDFIDSAESTVIARLARLSLEEDAELAMVRGVLNGRSSWLVFEFRVNGLSDPTTSSKRLIPGDVRLIAGHREGIEPRRVINRPRFEQYLIRIIRTLEEWQAAIVEEEPL